MSDHSAASTTHDGESTIADIVSGVEPMGDLSRFVIEDLSPEEEDEFYAILDNA